MYDHILLCTDQDMLSRLHQELNARFLQDRSLLPLGLPPIPFTLHTEMHQHQHLHHHQHVLTPGTYLPTPAAPSAAAATGLFQPSMPEVEHSCIWWWLNICCCSIVFCCKLIIETAATTLTKFGDFCTKFCCPHDVATNSSELVAAVIVIQCSWHFVLPVGYLMFWYV